MTTVVELLLVAERSWTWLGRPQAVFRWPMLIHTYHAAPLPCCVLALRSRFQNGMVGARHGHGMVCVDQTRPHCVNHMGKIQSKPLATRHGRGTAWARRGLGVGTACCVWISLYTLSNRHEYGNIEQTTELLKPCNKGIKMNCWESFLQKQNILSTNRDLTTLTLCTNWHETLHFVIPTSGFSLLLTSTPHAPNQGKSLKSINII